MSDMNGNPHFVDRLVDESSSADGRSISAATLALAYEQRTANLLACLEAISGRASHTEMSELSAAIRKRLGLEQP